MALSALRLRHFAREQAFCQKALTCWRSEAKFLHSHSMDEAREAHFQSFRGARVQGSLELPRATFVGATDFAYVHVENSLILMGTTILAPIDLSNTAVGQSLNFIEAKWPTSPEVLSKVHFDGLTYRHLEGGRQVPTMMLPLIDSIAFDADVYTVLEQFLKAEGYPDQADDAFQHRKDRERRDRLKCYQPAYWSNLVTGVLLGHGRRPVRALAVTFVFYLLGVFVYWREHHVDCVTVAAHPRYSPWWYSLALLLPIVDLRYSKHWVPSQVSTFHRHYERIHTLAGWLLVPLGLAALTGLVK